MVKTEKFIAQAIEEIKKEAGNEKVVMALSGGVDSSVCAALAARAIGDNLIPIYIDYRPDAERRDRTDTNGVREYPAPGSRCR